MAQNSRNNQHKAIKGTQKQKKRSYRSISSIVEAFETKLLEADKQELQPARFLSEINCKKFDYKEFVGILMVSRLLVREGILDFHKSVEIIGAQKIEHHKNMLLNQLSGL